ncbi:hypothetical protein F511_11782 [Dorcoceras hygrometricum]|uniref:Uncharacterized protein n=1 Tax=Dorcoceras hygrometricum TaxID=472368 RepID=A0A2Z7CDR5_9LAMI|nr:hypothetical protein F511_11782 [Dorcoceras hygrometricum]
MIQHKLNQTNRRGQLIRDMIIRNNYARGDGKYEIEHQRVQEEVADDIRYWQRLPDNHGGDPEGKR